MTRTWRCWACLAAAAWAATPAAAEPGTRWAVLIGVNDYAEISKLRFAGADMRALAGRLVEIGYPPDQVFLLDDKSETKYRPFRANIERQLELVLRLAEPPDQVLVAFSGHGVQLDGKSYLCPLDTRVDRLQETVLPLESIYQSLDTARARLKLLLIDACRSDLLPAGRRSLVAKSVGEFAAAAAPPAGILLLSSCGPGQVSMEDDAFGHGVFMHYMLEGLRGEAANAEGTISLAGLYDYASLQTKKYVARKFNELQTPALRGDISGPFLIGRRSAEPRPLEEGTTNSLGMKLVRIPAGEFVMGSPADEALRREHEGPQHRVRVNRAFYLAAHEVTRGQFRRFVEASGYRTDGERDGKGGWTRNGDVQGPEYGYLDAGFGQDDDHPVMNVSWNDAVAFCRWLGRREQARYRLPTEAEWEYACRAGTTTAFSFGAGMNGTQANGNGAEPYGMRERGPLLSRTSAVGSYPPNAFGLYDMHGNVWEWVQDWYHEGYYAQSPIDDPPGPATGVWKVFRGGGFRFNCDASRSAARGPNPPDARFYDLGFRVARDL